MLARQQVKSGFAHPFTEPVGVALQLLRSSLDDSRMSSTASDAPATAGATELENRYGRARCFSTQRSRSRSDVAAARTTECLAEGAGENVDPICDAETFGVP